jgi:transposase InsO family protein
VPATHEVEEKLPAVSGSSGRLVIERPKDPSQERSWPGQVFNNPDLGYEEAMLAFVAASRVQSTPENGQELSADPSIKEQNRQLRQEEAHLRDQRRVVRQQRKAEDAAWKALKKERQAQKQADIERSRAEDEAQKARWRALRQQRQEEQKQRKEADLQWKQERLAIRQELSTLPIVTMWLAILVITDNCSRQCLGLPLFVAGPRVTAEMVAEALQVLLPPELLFLISDRGIHFRAEVFRLLAQQEEFIHVLIARHRPQSNGIAERFVRTLKVWLKDKSWQDDQELAVLLERFLAEYNDRPHQGLPIPGLSPNEFANRIWVS